MGLTKIYAKLKSSQCRPLVYLLTGVYRKEFQGQWDAQWFPRLLVWISVRPSLPSPGLAAAWWATGLVCTLYLYTSLSFIFRSVVYAEMEEVRFVVTIIVARSSRPAADFHLSTQSVRR